LELSKHSNVLAAFLFVSGFKFQVSGLKFEV